MTAGKDFIYARKNVYEIVYMFLDEDCKNAYVNSAIYSDVCKQMEKVPVDKVEMIAL